MEGAAVCALRIDGVKHEFDSLEHVVEDITEIVLNLKKVSLNYTGDTVKILEIKKDKAGIVTAADIVSDGSVEVLNPDQIICTLDKNVPFRAEIEIMRGKGYIPAEKSKIARSIGTIPVDCLFSPVTRVNYQVGSARVGEETEMDSLEMEIWTDGRIAPKDALEASAAILRDHLQIFVGGQVAEKDVISMMKEDELRLYKVLAQDVEVLDLSVRAMNCLNSADIRIVGELCSKSEARMLKYRNFGKKSLDEIKEKIEKIGLGLGMTFSENIMIALDKESEKLRLNNEENK
jgi:DNA-directed RNA polymerase subunit alpha